MSAAQTFRAFMFEAGALPYAFLTAQPTWRKHGAELARHVQARPGERLLDLGCGPGVSAFGVLEEEPGLRVVGLDVSQVMIRFARWFQAREPLGDRIEFVIGDAMRLPFPDASFDAAVGHSFLYLVPDADRVLAEVSRVLRPGGRCAFLEPNAGADRFPRTLLSQARHEPRFVTSMALWRIVSRGYGRFDPDRFAASFARAGLSLERCEATLEGLGLFGVGRKDAPEGP